MEARELLNKFKQSRRKLAALIDWFLKAKRGSETAQAAAVMQEIDKELLPKVEKGFEAEKKLWLINRQITGRS
jgi:hypothetical protein